MLMIFLSGQGNYLKLTLKPDSLTRTHLCDDAQEKCIFLGRPQGGALHL